MPFSNLSTRGGSTSRSANLWVFALSNSSSLLFFQKCLFPPKTCILGLAWSVVSLSGVFMAEGVCMHMQSIPYEDQGYQLHTLVLSCWWKPTHHPSSHCWTWWAHFQHQLCLKVSHLRAAGSSLLAAAPEPACGPGCLGHRQSRERGWLQLHHRVWPAACAESLSHYFVSRAHNYFNVGLGCKNKNIHKSIWNYFIKY